MAKTAKSTTRKPADGAGAKAAKPAKGAKAAANKEPASQPGEEGAGALDAVLRVAGEADNGVVNVFGTKIGALGSAGHLILIQALRIAPASLIAPFTYSQIIWALILGYLVFGDVPDGWMLAGCAVIIGSGLFVFYREAVLGRR